MSSATTRSPGSPMLGVGCDISNLSGRSLGRVVAEERRSWLLANGRTVSKATENRRWRWATPRAGSVSPMLEVDDLGRSARRTSGASHSDGGSGNSPFLLPDPALPLPPLEALPEASMAPRDAPTRLSATKGVGGEIVAVDGKAWGLVVAEENNYWRLVDGRLAKKNSEGRKWRWSSEVPGRIAAVALGAATLEPLLAGGGLPDHVLKNVSDWLPLRAALRLTMSCRAWAAALVGHLPAVLLPRQVDELLQFCLLEVLVVFDDDRLPLPISAVYGEMRAAARRAVAEPKTRAHLEAYIFRESGRTSKSPQQQPLKESRPHHIFWEAEIKSSGFRTLEKFGKHFGEAKLIETFRQRFHKRIHHSPNTRTCMEWLLTKVNRRHPLFLEHERWAGHADRSATPAPRERGMR